MIARLARLVDLGLHRRAWALWVVVRAGLLAITAWGGLVDGDLALYAAWARAWSDGRAPYVDVPVEYPPGILPFLRLPAGSDLQYAAAFVALALAADALVLRLLRSDGRAAGATLWLAMPLLLGPVAWRRTDVFVALALVAAVWAGRRGLAGTAALCVVAAASLKLWPAALLVLALPALPTSARRRFLVVGGAAGAALCAAVVASGALPGLVWMLEYHAHRGLQVESLAATGAHLLVLLGADLTVVPDFGSLEFTAAAVRPVLTACSALLVLGVAACGWVAARAHRCGPADLAPVVLALTLVFAVSSKVLSAQYAVWIVAAVATAVDSTRFRDQLAAAAAALLLTTQYVFPITFGSIVAGSGAATCALLLHGAALAWLATVGARAVLDGVHRGGQCGADRCAGPALASVG